MIRGVSAEAAREAKIHFDGVTGKVLGNPEIRDLSQNRELMCDLEAPRK